MTDTRNPDPHAELRAKYQAMVAACNDSNEAARAFEFRPTYQSNWIRFKNGGISFLPEYEYRFNPIFTGVEGSGQIFTLHPTKSATDVYLELAEKFFALRTENEALKATLDTIQRACKGD